MFPPHTWMIQVVVGSQTSWSCNLLYKGWERAGELEAGMDVYAETSLRAVGKVQLAGTGGRGLAMLRLQAAFGENPSVLHAGAPDGPVLTAARPSWWLPEWGHEAE